MAMYKNVDKDKLKNYKPVFISSMLACFLTGVTEPVEFMFMFVSPILYVAYAIITGLGFAIADIINLRIHSFGFIELLTRIHMIIKAGIVWDLVNFILVCWVFFVINFFVFDILIRKFDIGTLGRKGNYIEETEESMSLSGDELSYKILSLLGDRKNIVDIDACMTRLRVTVKDTSKVASENEWRKTGAIGILVKDNGVQVIYGPKADVIKSNLLDTVGV